MTYKKCRKKPIIVEFKEVTDEFIYDVGTKTYTTPETHYLIRGVDGEIYPITKEIFHKTYEILGKTK